MKKYFLNLYRYNAWANRRVIDALTRQQVSDEQVLTLAGHIAAAQFIWLHRIKGLPAPDLKLWGTYNLNRLADLVEGSDAEWLAFVESNTDFDREIQYKNLAGVPYASNLEAIMSHVINHSSYHRGQIAVLLRKAGLEPVSTDFIIYDRALSTQLKE